MDGDDSGRETPAPEGPVRSVRTTAGCGRRAVKPVTAEVVVVRKQGFRDKVFAAVLGFEESTRQQGDMWGHDLYEARRLGALLPTPPEVTASMRESVVARPQPLTPDQSCRLDELVRDHVANGRPIRRLPPGPRPLPNYIGVREFGDGHVFGRAHH